jgi:hypothetical protein
MFSGTALEPFHLFHDSAVFGFQSGHALLHLPTFLLGFIVFPLYLHQSNLQLLKACFHTMALGLQLLGVCAHLGMRTVTLMMTDVMSSVTVMIVVMAACVAFQLLANLMDMVFQFLCVLVLTCVVQLLDLTLKVM